MFQVDSSSGAVGGHIAPACLHDLRYRHLLERLPVGVYAAALESGSPTLYASPRVETILGIPPERLISDPGAWIEAVHGEDRARVLAALERTHSTGQPFREEYRLRGDDGRDRWVYDDAVVIDDPDGRPLFLQGILQDVSERKRAEEALRLQRDVQREILSRLPLMVTLLDPVGRVTWVNRAWEETMGWSCEEARGRDHRAETLPGAASGAVEATSPNGEAWQDLEVTTRDGRVLDTAWALTMLPDGTSVAIGRDVTQERQAQEALRESEATLRSFSESAPGLMGIVELRGDDILHLRDNDAVCRFLGVAGGGSAGKLSSELGIPPEAIRAWSERYRESEAKGGAVSFEQHYGDGSREAWLRLTVAPIGRGPSGAMRFCYVGEDQTQQRITEREMERASAQLSAIVATVPLAVIGVDAELRVILWNDAAEQTFGWKAEEVLGRTCPVEGANDSDLPGAILQEALAGARCRGREIRRRTKEGRILDLLLWTAPLLAADGSVRGLVGVMADSSEKKRLEAELRQAQKMEAVGRLAGGVAHDFNNLLTAISCNAEFLLEDLPPDDPRSADAREIAAAADRGKSLTRQLLAFSRKQILHPVVLDVNQVLRDMESLIRRLLGEDVALTVDLDPGVGGVLADRGQLEQCLMNLAVNARDAMPRGGPLRLRTRALPPGEGGAPEGSFVEIEMSDRGHGMSEETIAHVFEPFFTTKAHGTGLGLATVYGIVQQAGGRIEVSSEEGIGTTFRIQLPVSPLMAAPGAVAKPAARPRLGAGETVLLVEDEPGVRRAAERILLQVGYRVLVAEHAEAALALAGQYAEPIHLLLSDVVMPGMSGRELSEALVALHPETRTLFMSGYTEDEILRRGVVELRERLITKPFSLPGLAREVRRTLDEAPPQVGGSP